MGFLLPNLVAVIQQPKFSSTNRAIITALVSVIGGFGTAYFTDQFKWDDIIGSVLITGVAAITFYKGFWQPTGVAPAIENATSKTDTGEQGNIDPIQALVVVILAVVLVFLIVQIF